MSIGRSDLADFTYFLAIAKHRSFRLAGLELGVSASALSHALKGLEGRLGVRLLNRTNRSVTLTAAGEELRDAITQPFSAIGQAVESCNRYRDAPTGRIRLNVVVDAAALLLGPVLPVFADRYPDIAVDVVATDRMVDVIGGGFDAGSATAAPCRKTWSPSGSLTTSAGWWLPRPATLNASASPNVRTIFSIIVAWAWRVLVTIASTGGSSKGRKANLPSAFQARSPLTRGEQCWLSHWVEQD